MINRWLTLVVGVALIQGRLSYSPIPVPEDEWAEFTRTLRDPAYRLPTTTRPSHYEVSLTPYFDNPPQNVQPFTFDGQVVIYLRATEQNVNQITIHCNDLTIQSLIVEYTVGTEVRQISVTGQSYECEMPYSFLRISTTETLQLDQEYVIRASFRGNLQTNMRGFYRSWYNDTTGRRWMATTQFQPGHARQAFPCYDEPGFKATFDITMNREPTFSPTISNMPIRTTDTLGNGRVAETFYTTPATSTYLLAFIVSHYVVVANGTNANRPFAIYARDNAGSTGDWSLEIGEKLLDAMEAYTQFPYYTMAQNMNMKQAAIPDFSAGAMENWGLLTYREALILYDPLNSNHFYRQRVANIVSHEIAHMWFGNLVTCAWWDNLWLNEGFARFYQYFLTHRVAPELGYDIRFIVEQVHDAMFADSVDTAHALTNPNVNDPTTVSAHFSTITYARGAAVLRMTQYLLGVDTFERGLRNYLQERQFDVAEPQHLFLALDVAAQADGALSNYPGITVNNYFRTWSEKAGHPLLTVSVDQATGRMSVTQARWERNTGVSLQGGLWHIPITWTRAGDPDFENLKPSEVITAQVSIIDRGTRGLEWVVFNKQESGFYRVNYDDTNWALLTRALRSDNRTVIHELNRAQIVDDLFALSRGNVMQYTQALNILSFLEFEDEYGPWIAAIRGFEFLLRRVAHDSDILQKLQTQIIRLSGAATTRLGFAEVSTETYMDGLLRMYLNQFLCNVGHEQCVNAGRTNFAQWRAGGFIPANLRPWVYCTGLRYGTAEDFDYFWNRYLVEDLASEQIVMLTAAGCTTNQASLERYLSAIVAAGEIVRPQDVSTAINSAVTSNEVNTMRAFNWLRNNVAQTTTTLGSIATPLNAITQRLLNEEQISEVQTWLDANRETIGTAYNNGVNGIATSRANLQWSAQRLNEVANYLESDYEEVIIEEIDDSVETDDGEEVEEEVITPEDGDDSANIAALSVITLIVTISINFVV